MFQTGIYGPGIEALLNAKGFTLGHFPQSFEYSTLGGWIVTRSAGQESSAYGRIEDIAISLSAFPSFEKGTEAIKQLVQKDIYPSVVRYSDEHETFFLSLLSHEQPSVLSKLKSSVSKAVSRFKGIETPSLLMVRLDGEKAESEWKRKIAGASVARVYGFE